MIRAGLVVTLAAVAAVATISLLGEPGGAMVTWLGWQLTTTAAAAVLIVAVFALAATVFWRGLFWVLAEPERARRAAAETRRRQGRELITQGFLAAAAGDGPLARRLAQRAGDFADEFPQLARLLAAQAAEAAQDHAAAKLAYAGMRGFPDMRLAAYRGLMLTAQAEGDDAGALRHAGAAYAIEGAPPWAWRALLESRLHGGDWAGALALVQEALGRKIVSPIVAERARAALQAVSAASLEVALGETAERALELAQLAARARPDFTPAAVVAARLLMAQGRAARAAPLIEAAWKARPHPALWLAWRDLRTDESPRERAVRLDALAALQAGSRESRIIAVEQALIANDLAVGRVAAAALDGEPTTHRQILGLPARPRRACRGA